MSKRTWRKIGLGVAISALSTISGLSVNWAPSSVNWNRADSVNWSSVNWNKADSVNWSSVNWNRSSSVNWS